MLNQPHTTTKLQGEALLTHLLFISRQMAEMRSLKPLLSFAVDAVLRMLGAEQGYIVLLQENGKLDYRVKRRVDGTEISAGEDPISHSILEEVIRTQKSVVVRNALTDPRFSAAMSVMILQLRSIMCVPLITRNRVIGALYVENRSKAGRFADVDLTPLEFFSAQASVAIENANLNDRNQQLYEAAQLELAERRRLEDKEQQRQAWLAKVVELGKTITLMTDLQDCLRMIRETVTTELGFDRGVFYMYSPHTRELQGTFGVAQDGTPRDEWDLRIPYSPNEPLHVVLSSPNGFVYDRVVDEENAAGHASAEPVVRENAMMAIWAGGEPVGVLVCDNFVTRRMFNTEQLEALQLWGGYAGLAVHNAQLLSAIKQLNVTLEQRVLERTTELHAAQKQIITQEKLASLGVLTAGVAHELRNPLNFVKNYAEASLELTQEVQEILPTPATPPTAENAAILRDNVADLIENLRSINQHSNRAEKVIQNMMQHVHTEIDQAVHQPTNLNELIEQAVKLAYHSQRAQNSNFNFAIQADYALDLPAVDLVAANFNRVIINLAENACDAMRAKQKMLRAAGPFGEFQPILKIKTSIKGEAAEIRLMDNGCGIPAKAKSKILDPFFTTKPVGEGVGLGLYITHDIIVNQHHGTLTFESQENEYTTVIIQIPLHQNIGPSS